MKYLALLTFPLLIISSCGGDEVESEPQLEVPQDNSMEAEEDTIISEEFVQDEFVHEWNQDSLKEVWNNLDQRRQDMWFQLEDARSSLLKFSYDYQSDYHGETSTWYFTEDFEPIFYYCDMAAEGGYMEETFYVLTDGQVSFAYYFEDDVGNPTRYLHYINTYEGGEDLVGFRNRRIDEVIGIVEEYYVPEIMEYDLNYFEWINEYKAEDYVAGAEFVNDQTEEEESIYGGTVKSGATISIDSALFNHFYK